MFKKDALRKLSSDVTESELEDMANLAYHIEHSGECELFERFADILDMYCIDYKTIMKIRDVIVEATENAKEASNDD